MKFSPKGAGFDDYDADAERLDFLRECLEQFLHRKL